MKNFPENGKKVLTSFAILGLVIGLQGCLGGGGVSLDGTSVSPAGGGSSGSGGQQGGSSGGSSNSYLLSGYGSKMTITGSSGSVATLGILTSEVTTNGGDATIKFNYKNKNEQERVTFQCQNGVCPPSGANRLLQYGSKGPYGNTYNYMNFGSWSYLSPASLNSYQDPVVKAVYGVTGQKTVNMPTSGSGKYAGGFNLFMAKDGWVPASYGGTVMPFGNEVRGIVDMHADFGRGSFYAFLHPKYSKGSISSSNSVTTASGKLTVIGDINGNTLTSSSISGDMRFTDVSGNPADIQVTKGSLVGAFFGRNAGEVGGGIIVKGGNYKGSGAFMAKRY